MAKGGVSVDRAAKPVLAKPGSRGLVHFGLLIRRNPNIAYGVGIVVLVALFAILAPVLFTTSPIAVNPPDRFVPPSASHWFGSDNLGRDVYSRTLYGARVSLIVAFADGLIAIAAGALIGLVAGFYPRVDSILMRVMDGLMAIPSVLLAMALMALLGGSVQNVIIAIAVTQTPLAARVMRSATLSIRARPYVEAARAVGATPYRIIAYHVFPNTIPPLIVQGTFIAAAAVLLEAYLSFLGAGTPADVTSWGQVMAEGQMYLSRAEWVIVFPGVFLTLTVLGISLAGDGLRDMLDPKIRRQL